MVEPVHPVVPLDEEQSEILPPFNAFGDPRWAVTKNENQRYQGKKTTQRKILDTPRPISVRRSHTVILGDIALHWSTLRSSSEGLQGVLLDAMKTTSRLPNNQEEKKKNEWIQTFGESRHGSKKNKYSTNVPQSFVNPEPKLHHPVEPSFETPLDSTKQLNNASQSPHDLDNDPTSQSLPFFHPKTSLNMSRQQWTYETQPSCHTPTSMPVQTREMTHTTIPSPQKTHSSGDDDPSALLLKTSEHHTFRSNSLRETVWTSEGRVVKNSWSVMKWWKRMTWAWSFTSLFSSLTQLWHRCIAAVNDFVSLRMIKEFKTQQILRNLTRRSHCCFVLLYFPATFQLPSTNTLESTKAHTCQRVAKDVFTAEISHDFLKINQKSPGRRRGRQQSNQYSSLPSSCSLTKLPLHITTPLPGDKRQSSPRRNSFSLATLVDGYQSKRAQGLKCPMKSMDSHVLRGKRHVRYSVSQSQQLIRRRPGHSCRPSVLTVGPSTPTSSPWEKLSPLSTSYHHGHKPSTLNENPRNPFPMVSKHHRRNSWVPRLKKYTTLKQRHSTSHRSETDLFTTMSSATDETQLAGEKWLRKNSFVTPRSLATWEPRIILYGGAIYDSLEGTRGSASDWLIDFSFYSPSPDQPQTCFSADHFDSSKPIKTDFSEDQEKKKASGVQDAILPQPLALFPENISSPHPTNTTHYDTLYSLSQGDTLALSFTSLSSSLYFSPKEYIFRLNSCIFSNVSDPYEGVDKVNNKKSNTLRHDLHITKDASAHFEPYGLSWNEVWDNDAKVFSGERQKPVQLFTSLSVPPARLGCSSVVHKGRVYIFGGAGIVKWRQATLMNDLWVLSPMTEEETQGIIGPKSIPDTPFGHRQARYIWSKFPLHTALRPPPCAFHLAGVNDGFMYVIISDCTVGHALNDFNIYGSDAVYPMSEQLDEHLLLNAEYARADSMQSHPNVLAHYRRALDYRKPSVNQIWRINLDASQPRWERFHVTIAKTMSMMVSGGIALTFYDDRLFVYGTFEGHSHVAIGVLDLHLRMWVASVRLPGAPVWVTAVAIGKLWFALGVEVWGIFNLETFEWRYDHAPKEATIRYGCSSVWLPPYIPFPSVKNLSSLLNHHNRLDPRDFNLFRRNDLSTQYFSSLLQKRRPMDHIHTILLVGGFDSKGELSNQIDQILVVLPEKLSMNCFHFPWHETNLFYASLFGVDALRNKSDKHHHVSGMYENGKKTGKCKDEKEQIIVKLQKELRRLKYEFAQQSAGFEAIIQQMQYRHYSKETHLLEKFLQQEHQIERLTLKLRQRYLR